MSLVGRKKATWDLLQTEVLQNAARFGSNYSAVSHSDGWDEIARENLSPGVSSGAPREGNVPAAIKDEIISWRG